MNQPLITAIIPTYKRPALLKRAVRSVLAQSYPHFEILIADNASGEETNTAIQKLMQQDKRIKVLQHPTNIGMTGNFQAALRHSTTPYVCFLPDDDFYAPQFFEEVIHLHHKYEDLAFCGGGGLIINQDYVVTEISSYGGQIAPSSGYYLPPSGLFAYLRSSFAICFPPLLFKSAILKQLGGFDLRIRNGADEHLISQCAARYPVYLTTDRPHYFGYQHEGSLSNTIDYPLFERETACLYENLSKIPLAHEERAEIDAFFQKRQLKILSNAYRYFCERKQFTEAHSYAAKITALTHSKIWQRKRVQAKIYEYLPALATVYKNIKSFERMIRCLGKKKDERPVRNYHLPDEKALFWKNYTLSLEE